MLDIPQESKVVLFLLYCYWCITKNLQACTDWTRFFTLGSLQSGAARRFQGMPQPQWAGTTRGWHAAVWQIYWDHLQGINVLLFLLCCYGCTTPNLHAPETFNSTQTGQVFYFGVPHNLQKPEYSLGSHNLNPNRECLGWVFQYVEGYTMLSMLGMA